MGQGTGWHVFELIMDLTTVFTRTGIAVFKYVQNTRILNCCHFVILKHTHIRHFYYRAMYTTEVGGEE